MDKLQSLKEIEKEIEKCRVCKKGMSGKAVPGEGNPEAKIIFIGEAPGRQEALTGRPFIGRSGNLLTKLLAKIKIDRKDVFITSPVKYYPGQRAPTPIEIAHGKVHLLKQIKIITPKYIVLLGNTAMKALLEGSFQVTKWHGKTITQGGATFFITFHPAAALRFPKKIQPLMEKDLKILQKLVLK
jgi:uracil-DNA glycosylase